MLGLNGRLNSVYTQTARKHESLKNRMLCISYASYLTNVFTRTTHPPIDPFQFEPPRDGEDEDIE